MQQWPFKLTTALNVITALCLSLLTLSAILNILSDGYQFGPSIMQEIASNALKSGAWELNQEAIYFSLVGYIVISIWGCIAFLLSLVKYRQDKQDGKKPLIWALTLFGANILVVVCLFTASHSCTLLSLYGSSPVCVLHL